jgi:putative lipoprotein (rSAM/lipoprotein system)
MKNKIVVALLGLLGFSSCVVNIGGADMYGPPPVMYAPLGFDFELKGTVTDEGNPIAGIHVTAKPGADSEHSFGEAVTDSEGNYSIVTDIGGTFPLIVTVEDIDGEANGGDFATQTKEDSVTEEELANGEVTKVIDFELELKTENQE